MIDLHCHAVWGIDDGPATIEDSLELARAAAAGGTRVLLATPHVSWEYRNEPGPIAALVAQLNERLVAEGIELEVRAGAEIATTRASDIPPEELSALTLGGGNCLLIEPPFTPIVAGIDMLIYGLQREGYRVLLAHPERCMAFHRDRSLLDAMVGAGVLTSITAGSLVGRFGRDVRRFALQLIHDELVHNVASDAHDAVRRPPGIAAELEEAGLEPLAEWLTQGVPEAILSGGEIPPRPFFESSEPRGGVLARWRTRL